MREEADKRLTRTCAANSNVVYHYDVCIDKVFPQVFLDYLPVHCNCQNGAAVPVSRGSATLVCPRVSFILNERVSNSFYTPRIELEGYRRADSVDAIGREARGSVFGANGGL